LAQVSLVAPARLCNKQSRGIRWRLLFWCQLTGWTHPSIAIPFSTLVSIKAAVCVASVGRLPVVGGSVALLLLLPLLMWLCRVLEHRVKV
jgi:hypothetical protein